MANQSNRDNARLAPAYPNLAPLPETGFVKLPQIIGDKERGIPALLPVSRTTWLEGVKTGRYPQPVKIGARAVAWRVDDIRELIQSIGAEV